MTSRRMWWHALRGVCIFPMAWYCTSIWQLIGVVVLTSVMHLSSQMTLIELIKERADGD